MHEKDEDLNLGSMLVKIHQGYEPPHFLQMFQGKFTIFNHYYTEFEREYKLIYTVFKFGQDFFYYF